MNTITFGGVLSSTYDIYISGEGVWSAPERDAEVITIPGRNGAFVQDNGRFQNITVTYPAFIVKDTNTNFKTKIDGFRNAIASKVGYQRLVDTFHADEYRMAAFIGGLEVEPILYNDHAATFDLVFECKPQRFLTSGETAVSVANNGTITNPTLFESSPLIAVKGYGDISFNNYSITVENATLGKVTLLNGQSNVGSFTFDNNLVNTSDELYVKGIDVTLIDDFGSSTITSISTPTKTASKSNADYLSYSISDAQITDADKHALSHNFQISRADFTYGTSGSVTLSVAETVYLNGGLAYSGGYKFKIEYDGVDTFTFSKYTTVPGWASINGSFSSVEANSTIPVLGNPTYLDCDLGLAYKIENGSYVSLNHCIDLGTDLPKLASGSNTVTYDNTYTEVKFTPRWWQV